jgi:hypothetical protein
LFEEGLAIDAELPPRPPQTLLPGVEFGEELFDLRNNPLLLGEGREGERDLTKLFLVELKPRSSSDKWTVIYLKEIVTKETVRSGMPENVSMVVYPKFPSDHVRHPSVWFQKGRCIFANENVFAVKKVSTNFPSLAGCSIIRKQFRLRLSLVSFVSFRRVNRASA